MGRDLGYQVLALSACTQNWTLVLAGKNKMKSMEEGGGQMEGKSNFCVVCEICDIVFCLG